MSEHDHTPDFVRDERFWNERYRVADRIWSGNPNPQLVAEAAGLAPGRAIDAGCGEGADSIWLARRGWSVVGVDIATVALERAAEHAHEVDAEAAGRIEWRRADLLADPPEADAFDLASAHYMQLPPEPRRELFATLAASVRSGGTLLIVGHHPSDLATGVPRPPMPELFYTGDDLAAELDESWTVVVNEARPRSAKTPDGVEVTIRDSVLRAVRHSGERRGAAAAGR